MTGNLFLIDRIDCEDEAPERTPLEHLVPNFIDRHRQGMAMPTLLIRCAGKRDDGVTSSPSSVKAISQLREHGSPTGLHVHTKRDEHRSKIPEHYFDPDQMRIQIEEGIGRFQTTFGESPRVFGMGDLACSCEAVAALLGEYGIQLDLGDIISPKHLWRDGEQFYDYTTANWRTDLPIYKHHMWWIPLGTDGVEGDQGSGTLGLNIGQDEQIFDQIFSRYRKLGESNPDKLVMISSVVHPPETLRRWDAWQQMHQIAALHGFRSITSLEAIDLLEATCQGEAAARG